MAITPDDYPLLIAAPMLQDYLVDKDSGAPLAGGIVTFYKDKDRQQLKNVYYQTGTPGDYSYIELPNPNILTAVGTIADDNGNDVIPFFFPYDESDPDVNETYFVTVYSSNSDGTPAILQFTRENFPFVSQADNPDITQQNLINLIPNGQFAAHNNLPNNGIFPNGDSEFIVAQGGSAGWYYTKNNTSTDTDIIVFDQILQEPSNMVGNPRFAINISCTDASGNDTFKELRVRFNNVNRFASNDQFYTFSFSGISNTPNTVNVNFSIIKYFGASGSATEQIVVEAFTLASSIYNQLQTSFVFGLNSEDTIGPGNDDYIELVIQLPSQQQYNLAMTNFCLTPGVVDFTNYPERPDNMVFSNGIAGSMPTPSPNGFDLYLPLVLTPSGVTFDQSKVGEIIAYSGTPSSGALLYCDGSVYPTSAYSSIGIPYRRLQSKLMAATGINIPLYGTGSTYATAYSMDSLPTAIRLSTNMPGAQTGAVDGSPATGFGFRNIHVGQAVSIKGYSAGVATLIGIATVIGPVTNANANTSGFTVTQLVNTLTNSYPIFRVITIAGGSIVPGSYFTFHVFGVNYYCWFTVDGVGIDPAPGGTGIRVNLLSPYSATEVASCVQESISGFQVSSIDCLAASSITPGAYWTFQANSIVYSVWYSINGVGSAPNVGTPIQVSLVGNETASQVANATKLAINSLYFAVPDLRGSYLLGRRVSGQFETNVDSRFSGITNYYRNQSGTFEPLLFSDVSNALTPAAYQMLNTYVDWYIRY